MTRILLACASRHGATAEIAEEIGDVLRREVPGAVVEVRDAAEPGDVDGFDAVVLGSAVYMGRWLPAAPGSPSRAAGDFSPADPSSAERDRACGRP